MKFGEIPTKQAIGAILAHSVQVAGARFRKGRVLSAEDIGALSEAGIDRVMAARLEAGDVDEDTAATRIARAAMGDGLSATAAFTGRVNLLAETAGIAVVDAAALEAINLVHESITIATVDDFEAVRPRQIVATIKIIPFATSEETVAQCESLARAATPLVEVQPLQERRAVFVQTTLPGLKQSVLDKSSAVMQARLAALGSRLVAEERCPHEIEALRKQLEHHRSADLILIAGASAITDRRDVIPAAIEASGGVIDHFGMPVDPGNLLLMGRLGDVPVIGLPGCVRSPKLNGFDWVLQRLCAGIPVGREDIMRMGVGGLLKDIPSRPLPRAEITRAAERGSAPAGPQAPRIGALVLAAGQSRRMGKTNKLLAEIDGVPMIRRVCDAVAHSQSTGIVVVTGHEPDRVVAALDGLTVQRIHNPDYAEGLSTSLQAGIAALPADWDGVVICLGDMPRVRSDEIDRLIAAFNPVEGRAVCVPTHRGKRGNPVLWARAFFEEIGSVMGDVGARHLIGANAEAVCEVEMASDGVVTDIDTPDALDQLRA